MRSSSFAIAALAAGLLGWGVVAQNGWGVVAQNPKTNTFQIEDIPKSKNFPVPENQLVGSVLSGDWAATRRHSWALWAALTAPSQSVWNGQRVPVWETWYSVSEVYSLGPKPPKRRDRTFELARPNQAFLAHPNARNPDPVLFAFVKYNRAAAEFVWQNKYHLQSTLDALQARFEREKTPIEERSIKPFPNDAIALKPVFWLVKNPKSKQSYNGLTVLPYWDPKAPPPPGGVTPDHRTWQQCVAVDPAGKFKPGTEVQVPLNGKMVTAKTVPLTRFYAIPLRDAAEVAAVKMFARELSSAGGEQERMITDPNQLPEIGDSIVFLAMHTTTKEMDNWTFQTFYWLPEPDAPPYGHDRPASIKGVWRNYVMCNAYSMVSPREPDGGYPICFNPYLETDLGPTKAITLSGKQYGPDPMAGTRSNCMNCHNRAGYPAFDDANPFSANMGGVANDGYRPPNDPYFQKMTKVDFLWSVALHAVKDKP